MSLPIDSKNAWSYNVTSPLIKAPILRGDLENCALTFEEILATPMNLLYHLL